jgi:hypothetical protein
MPTQLLVVPNAPYGKKTTVLLSASATVAEQPKRWACATVDLARSRSSLG